MTAEDLRAADEAGRRTSQADARWPAMMPQVQRFLRHCMPCVADREEESRPGGRDLNLWRHEIHLMSLTYLFTPARPALPLVPTHTLVCHLRTVHAEEKKRVAVLACFSY